VSENSWYGKVLFLGEEDAPIFTFTNENFLAEEINVPNHHYLEGSTVILMDKDQDHREKRGWHF